METGQERLKEILAEAIARTDPLARAAYLDGACAGDAALRSKVEGLIVAYEKQGDLVERTLAVPGLVQEGPGTIIGRYKLLQEIGEGGFGLVYMAEQAEPVQRKVALKIIKAGMDTRAVIARFEAEEQALALMDHPNIAQVLDAGTTETGRPYFVMELVKGLPITAYADQYNLTTEERLQLFLQVCHSVQHAHQKGIIHRDLKPTNILVTLIDGQPVPKIIDFGVAKALGQRLTDKTLFTAFDQIIGTPAYMSPEQAELSGVDIDTRADIYALGVLLYELLTGVTPFDQETLRQAALDEARRIIRETEPPMPSTRLHALGEKLTEVAKHRQTEPATLNRLVRGDLDWIVMKCLDKDRRRRYETAGSLAEDLQRHRGHQPVQASPPSTAYRARRFIRRHRTGVALAASVTAALIAGLVVSLIGFKRARQERDHALVAEAEAQQQQARAEQLARQEAEQRRRAEAGEKKARAEALKSTQVAQFLKDMLGGLGPEVARGRDTTMLREILDRTAERVGKDLNNQPEVQAELLFTMGWVYRALGVLDKAETLHREALEIRKRLFGKESAEVAASLFQLASVFHADYDGRKAEPLYREALAIRRKVLGNEHVDVAASLKGLLDAVQLSRRAYDEGEALSREALATRRKLLGSEHPDTVSSLGDLAYNLKQQGRLDEAERLMREVLALHRKLYVTDHPGLAGSISSLAQILEDKRNLAEAETLYREVLEMRQRLLGNGHGLVLMGHWRLGTVLLAQDKLAEAEASFREVGKAKSDQLKTGPGTVALGGSAAGLAEVFYRQGRLAELVTVDGSAEFLNAIAWHLATSGNPEFKDKSVAVLVAEKAVALTSRTNQWILDTLAAAYAEAGQFTNAVNVQNEAIALLKTKEDKEDYASRLRLYKSGTPYRHWSLLAKQANSLVQAGRFPEAEPLARQCLALCEQLMPEEWPTFSAADRLARSLFGQRRYAEAEQVCLEALVKLRKTGKPESYFMSLFCRGLARALGSQLKFSEAAAVLREDAERGNPETLADLSWLLATCSEAAVRNGLKAMEFAEKAVAASDRGSARYLGTLAAAYAQAGQFTNAVKAQEEAIALLTTEAEKEDYASRLRLYVSGIPCRDARPLEHRAGALLDQDRFDEAESAARECLALCEKQIPENWLTFDARSLLGGSLLGQKKYAEAEPLLVSGYEGIKQRKARIPLEGRRRLAEALQRLVRLYDATDGPAQAAEWKQKLAEFEQAETLGKPATPPK